MISLLIAAAISLIITILGTPVAIRVLRKNDIGQFIQEELEGHAHKRGTPTMGGVVMLFGVVAGYIVAHFRFFSFGEGFGFFSQPFAAEGWLAVFGFLGMGAIGFFDDFTKYARKENKGLSKRWKFGGQLAVAGLFAWGAVAADVSTELSITRTTGIDLGPWLYGLLVLLMLTAAANAVNLTDGLDGLVAGSGSLVFGAYVLVAFWQFRNPATYMVDGALDLGMFAAAVVGAVLGFLWWNAAPAKIIMGDTGSQALGGALAAMALLTNTHLLLPLLGGLYVMVTVSVILQVFSFRVFGKRIFRMAPIHHHFELKGWPETTVIIRFWILAGAMVAVGVGLFYADFLVITEGGL
ncbi:MAG: phospho-N-acetylmuramoyl-pentapeptide-transferase [Acidimicrobiia bacterium]|nr:phospho-N-acetylmuramoyl-pentapeptide-transferase [Acidimicrobiia bacterium]